MPGGAAAAAAVRPLCSGLTDREACLEMLQVCRGREGAAAQAVAAPRWCRGLNRSGAAAMHRRTSCGSASKACSSFLHAARVSLNELCFFLPRGVRMQSSAKQYSNTYCAQSDGGERSTRASTAWVPRKNQPQKDLKVRLEQKRQNLKADSAGTMRQGCTGAAGLTKSATFLHRAVSAGAHWRCRKER